MVSESTLTLDILPLSADTARLVRVYGTEPCIALPGTPVSYTHLEKTMLCFHQTDDYVAGLLTAEENTELLRLLNKLRDALQ